MSFLKKLALFVFFITPIALVYYFLNLPLTDLRSRFLIKQNNYICKEEIEDLLMIDLKEGKRFLEYNPLEFSSKLEKHPLIKTAQVRSYLAPEAKFLIIINEEEPWAFYRNKLYNKSFDLVKDFDRKETFQDCESVLTLYNSILGNKTDIVKIISNSDLSKKEMQKLKTIIDDFDLRLKMINQPTIKSLSLIDKDLTMRSKNLKFKFGDFTENYKEKINKLEMLLPEISNAVEDIAYLDLSLDTKEAIIGLRKQLKGPFVE